MFALSLELARTVLILSSSPITFRIRMISSMIFSCPTKVAKALPVARLATQKLLVSVDAIVCLGLLVNALTDKHMDIELPNLLLVRH